MSKPANQLWKRYIPNSCSTSPTTFRSRPLLTLPVSNRFRCSQLAGNHYRAVGCGVELDTFWLQSLGQVKRYRCSTIRQEDEEARWIHRNVSARSRSPTGNTYPKSQRIPSTAVLVLLSLAPRKHTASRRGATPGRAISLVAMAVWNHCLEVQRKASGTTFDAAFGVVERQECQTDLSSSIHLQAACLPQVHTIRSVELGPSTSVKPEDAKHKSKLDDFETINSQSCSIPCHSVSSSSHLMSGCYSIGYKKRRRRGEFVKSRGVVP